MASLRIVRKRKASKKPAGAWKTWKALIRTRYLVENKGLDEIMAELGELGLEVTWVSQCIDGNFLAPLLMLPTSRNPQLEFRLKTWGFRKNLRPDTCRYVGSVIQDRTAALKKSVVILSGQRLSPEKVDYAIKRNQLVRWTPSMLST